MTATHEPVVRPVSLGPAAATFAVLGLIDVALTGVIGSPSAPPLIVSLGVAALGPVWIMIVKGFAIAGTITALALVYPSRRLS
jgi:hypothetical protein